MFCVLDYTERLIKFSRNSILVSKPVTFLIKKNKKKSTVYAIFIAYHSRPLGVLINKHLLEIKVSCLLEDIDEDTFARFAQYAYTKDYLFINPEMVFKKTQYGIFYYKHVLQEGSPSF